jgi:uncharacterized RDD family membrane protein YckC
MSEDNLYAAPEAPLDEVATKSGLVLATRGARFGAGFIDGLIYLAVFIPAMAFIGFGKFTDPQWSESLSTKLLFLAFAIPGYALNWYFVQQSGQTIGKKVAKIRMVRTDGSPLDANRWLFIRILPVYLGSQLPFVGPWLSIINALFVFRKDRRCLHDHIADTMVVEA